MKSVIRFFLSIKTAYGFSLFFVVILLIGSLSLPANLAFFSGIDDAPLFAWLAEAGGYGTTWWIYALIAGLALFAVNTLFCTFEFALFRLRGRNFIARVSPHVVHLGALFVMLGHLLTATAGTRMDIDLKAGETKHAAGPMSIFLAGVKEDVDENGYAVDWNADIRWIENGESSEILALRPAHPVYAGGYRIYSKSVAVSAEGESALVRVTRDPGAGPALFGGILLCVGGFGFVYGRFNASNSAFQP